MSKRCTRCQGVWPRKTNERYAPPYRDGLVPVPTSRFRMLGFRQSMLCPYCGGTGYEDGPELIAHVARTGILRPKKDALS